MSEPIKLVFIGASTAVGEILELVNALNTENAYEVIGALDDDPSLVGGEVAGVPIIGSLEKAKELSDVKFIFSIGSHKTRLNRLEILDRLNLQEDRFVTLIHPQAIVYPSVQIGGGCIIHAGVCIAPNVKVGSFCIITFNAVIGPNVILGHGALVTSLVFIGSGAKIGPCSFIGAASAVGENVVIGPGAMVGMGSSIYRDVSKGVFVLGNPAKTVYPLHVPDRICENWDY